MPRARKSNKKPIEQYDHKGSQRLNNPPVGLVTPETDQEAGKKTYAYDPHLDPQLTWAGKAEHTSFEVPTVSLHVHERIDPRTIIEAVRKRNGQIPDQLSLFASSVENPPLREAIEFYKHKHNWSNRLIAGDSLLVMNSLLEKEGMAGKVQMIYLDPPYGIKYGSNFQPFVNRRDVKDGSDEDLIQEPETLRAFRDTWELGIHSYLTYLRDRLFLVRELLSESGSVFVQISDENIHLVRNLLDEAFGTKNFVSQISFQKTGGIASRLLGTTVDYLLWYAKNKDLCKYHQLYLPRQPGDTALDRYDTLELEDGTIRRLVLDEQSTNKIPEGARRFQLFPLYSEGESTGSTPEFVYNNKSYKLRPGTHWKTTIDGLRNLVGAGRIAIMGNVIRYKRYAEDFPVIPLTDRWESTQIGIQRVYVVQTSTSVIQRCILMTTDPGDLVFDPTCGSGTTAYVAEQWGRRWITCDTSRVSITLAKQRLMTALYDYYELARPVEGIGSGFRYKTVPHITLKSIANNEPPTPETLYDQPLANNAKVRVSGPFTMEAVPAPAVKPLLEIESEQTADESIARSGETLRQAEWRDELLKTGIRGKGGQKIEFSRVEPLPGTRWLHADAETKDDHPQRVVVSFGPEHAPLEQRQVALAIEEAQKLVPKPAIIVFASFQFDPEAAKDIDETNWPGVTLLKAQMNTDLLTEDLKKKRSSNESFWLIGQPDVYLEQVKEGDDNGKYRVEVLGFDYYNTKTEKTILPLHLTDRDREILQSVFDFRILTSDQIQELIPGSNQQILRRLQTLTAHGYLVRHQRTSAHIPYLYQIAQQAGKELTAYYGIEPERAKKRAKKLSAHDVQHSLMMSRLQFAVVRAVAERPDIAIAECILEDELPYHAVTYEEGGRVIKVALQHDVLLVLRHQGRRLNLPTEADRSTERGKIVETKMKAYYHLWLQEREKARRSEAAFYPFRVLWVVLSVARMENLRTYCMALNGGRGTALHWFTTESNYADPSQFFTPIWKTGRTGDDTMHNLLETGERERLR